MSKLAQAIGLVISAMIIFFVIAAVMAFPTKWLVNYIFSQTTLLAVFGVAKFDFWRALAVNYLFMYWFKSTK